MSLRRKARTAFTRTIATATPSSCSHHRSGEIARFPQTADLRKDLSLGANDGLLGSFRQKQLDCNWGQRAAKDVLSNPVLAMRLTSLPNGSRFFHVHKRTASVGADAAQLKTRGTEIQITFTIWHAIATLRWSCYVSSISSPADARTQELMARTYGQLKC